MADGWEKGFVDRIKGTGQSYGKEQIGRDYSKQVDYIFDIIQELCEKINSLYGEKIAHMFRESSAATVCVKQYYLRAALDERGKLLFSSNGSVLSFTKASPIESNRKVKWVYRDFNKNLTLELSKESIQLLFDEAFRNI